MEISTKGIYYGSKDAELAIQEILLSQYDYQQAQTPWHYHENPYFMFVLHGHMIDTNAKAKTLLPAGSLMFTNWQEIHCGIRHSEQAGGFHLEFEKSWFEKHDIPIDLLEGSQHIENPHIHFLFVKLYWEFMLSDAYSEVATETLLVQICDALIKVKTTNYGAMPHWVNQLKELLHEDPSNLSLKALSQQLNVHPVHISRAAPKYLSTSLGEYIRQVKLKKALPLLLNTHHSLTHIAYACGFSDQSHFHRVFKAYLQQSPGQFRKNLKKSFIC